MNIVREDSVQNCVHIGLRPVVSLERCEWICCVLGRGVRISIKPMIWVVFVICFKDWRGSGGAGVFVFLRTTVSRRR